jgi:hypothetical protein
VTFSEQHGTVQKCFCCEVETAASIHEEGSEDSSTVGGVNNFVPRESLHAVTPAGRCGCRAGDADALLADHRNGICALDERPERPNPPDKTRFVELPLLQRISKRVSGSGWE